MPPELPAVEIASPAAPVHRYQSSARPDELVQAWVGQNVLECNVFKTIFFAPPCVADGHCDAGRRGHTMASAAVSSRGGSLGSCDDAPLQGWSCARRAGSWPGTLWRRASIQRRLMLPELPAVEIASHASPVHRDQSSARPDGAGCCRFDRRRHVVTQRQRLSPITQLLTYHPVSYTHLTLPTICSV